jgi:hypothetical protein
MLPRQSSLVLGFRSSPHLATRPTRASETKAHYLANVSSAALNLEVPEPTCGNRSNLNSPLWH